MVAHNIGYPKVSIITVCFNSGGTIRDTLLSVQSQNYPHIEHVIVDGGSSDDTMGIVAEFRDSLGPVVSEPDNGLYDAMNKGIGMATGDVIGILNSDDFFEDSEVVRTVMQAFEDNLSVDVVFGDVVFVAPSDLRSIIRFYQAGHFRPWKLRFGWMPPHPATFVRRSVYAQFGGYRLDMKISADFEMFVRWLVKHKLRYCWIDKVIVRMRSGGASTAGLKSSLILNTEIVRSCRENGLYTNLAFVLTKVPLKLLELVRRPSGKKLSG